MSAIKTIDVKGLEHGRREELIFPGIEALKPGEAARLVVEFNPLPLVFLLKTQGEHDVAYEKEGPDEWVLKVTRKGEPDKKEQFRDLLTELREGGPSEASKAKARSLLETVDAKALGIMEQELIREGVSHEEIRKSLCDIHLEVMKDSLVAKRREVGAPHPVHTFMQEHEIIVDYLKQLDALVQRLAVVASYAGMGDDVERLKDIAHHLAEAEKHHQREEEGLFPMMEAHDVVEPPEIMKLDHAEFRKRKHALDELARSTQSVAFPEYKARVTEYGHYLTKELESHIFKEDNILYQIALQVLTPEEWRLVKQKCDEIGYCCFTPEDHKEENHMIELDLRQIMPFERHELIFQKWDELKPGDTLKIINDHDPKPLRYQFEAEYKGQYEWQYDQQGPKDWAVRIKRVAAAAGADGKKPTKLLTDEHAAVLQKLAALERDLANLDKREAISAEFNDLLAFFKTDFWVHFTKEEDALFPEIETFLPRNAGPLGVMLIEHEDLRKTNDVIQQTAAEYLRGEAGETTKATLRKQGMHFISLLRDHINKEDNILFVMANMHLNEDQMAKITKLFGTIEGGAKAKVG